MLYRWGFIDNGVFTECKPIVDDDAAIDFAPQTNDVFYRAKLNGGLSFRFEFDDILAKGYNYEHIIVLQYFNQDLNDWGEVWRGRFALTDCEIDYDTHTISVQPETQDRYTKVLDALEKEYNLIKLAPIQQPVNILVRPCLQLYALNSSKITNYIGHNCWEASCSSVGFSDITNYHFKQKTETFFCRINYEAGMLETNPVTVEYFGDCSVLTTIDGQTDAFMTIGRYWSYYSQQYETTTQVFRKVQQTTQTQFIPTLNRAGYTCQIIIIYNKDEAGTSETNLSYAIGDVEMIDGWDSQWDAYYGRVLCNSDLADVTILGDNYTLYDISNNDMAGVNLNYNKIVEYITGFELEGSAVTQQEPTQWGVSFNDDYFVKPTDTATKHYMPVGQETWKYASYWWYDKAIIGGYCMDVVDNILKTTHKIADSFLLSSVVLKLLTRAGWTGQYFISRAFGGNNDYVGEPFIPVITPRSNIISSYYDTPAQNAPISLQKVLNMFKQAYKAYWYIDSNNNFHIEHISYYDNGYSYSDAEPDLLVDLENHQHTNTKENKVFGQNKIKYDKQDMPEQFTFGWGDQQTKPFDGWPINCLDLYVQKGQQEENTIATFDTDVDFVLTSPNDVSKDGFFLFACPAENGSSDYTLKIEKVRIKDDSGDVYDVTIQNADAAFVKIHESWWRYALPCENINVNNQDTTAITTGRYKLQNVEFADEIMAEILADIDNCNKVIRTQQGDGKIKSLSINLNSLKAKGDLLFNFVGRWYYLRGTALGASIVINVDNEPITIEVSDNKWRLKYAEPMTALDFNGADVVSVDFADCDRLENLTTADGMFENCAELLAVDFGGKKLAAVTSAVDMFTGCAQLTTLICPQTSTWKPDLSFADCPDLTTESVYSLLGYLYSYESGVHTIDLNSTMWNALDADTQTDITTKAGAKGWTIGTAVAYYISGQSAAGTVYATINGASVEIPVSGGAFNYAYYAPITSLSFENDGDVTDIDFSLSDGLAGVTSLANAFKNCAGLTTLDFTNCDLTNVTTASDCFAGCVALYTLEIPTGTWKPDVDLSDTVILYSEMLNVVDGLYSYTGGVHNVTFNSTIWDAMSVAEQQAVFDAAALKYWTTNSVAVVYTISGKSTAASETFDITFIQDGSLTPDATETITVSVDGSGNWSFSYMNKKVYSLYKFATNNTTITSFDFSAADDFSALTNMYQAFYSMSAITAFDFSGKLLQNVTDAEQAFNVINACTTIDLGDATFASLTNAKSMFSQTATAAAKAIDLRSATFNSLQNAYFMFNGIKLTAIDLSVATFENVTNAQGMFGGISSTIGISMPLATFESATITQTMFGQSSGITSISIPNATFENVVTATQMIYNCPNLTSLNLDKATFNSVISANYMFNVLTKLQTISLPLATFKNVTTAIGIFSQYNNAQMTTIYIPNATFESITVSSYANFFNGNFGNSIVNWTTKAVGVDNKSIGVTFAFYAPRLNYTSYLNVANWVKDLSGLTAQTITLSAVAWNALSAAEQTTIDGILSGKNWTRAIA